MCKTIKNLVVVCAVVGLIVAVSGTARANWFEDFNDMTFDQTWTWQRYPDLFGSFTAGTIVDGPGSDDYLEMEELYAPIPPNYGAAFGGAFVDENFTDVRVGAVVGAGGDANDYPYCYHGILSRVSYIIDDGSISGAPGVLADTYVMLIAWGEEAPTDVFAIEVQKVRYNNNMMNDPEDVLTLDLTEFPSPQDFNLLRSYYAELDVVGSNPVYVTGSLYEYKGGPLIARLPTMVDTDAQDWWEDATDALGNPEGVKVLKQGVSGLTGFDEDETPAGWYVTFDDIFSIFDGPAAACVSPADGATGVSLNADLSWAEAGFATSRELWFGREGAMKKVVPAPGSNSYDPGPLEYGQTYEWRVDEIGPTTTVTGHVWRFTTEYLVVEDFESYNPAVHEVWKDCRTNNTGAYVYLETIVAHDGKSMAYLYNDACSTWGPYYSEAKADVADLPSGIGSDWTIGGARALMLSFYGDPGNSIDPMWVQLGDTDGTSAKVTYGSYPDENPSDINEPSWHEWHIALADFTDVNVASVNDIAIGFGDGTPRGVQDENYIVYFDDIRLHAPRCILSRRSADFAKLDYAGNDCVVDCEELKTMADEWLTSGIKADIVADNEVNFKDYALMARGWLDEGLWP